MQRSTIRGGVFLLLASLMLSSCSNPETQKRRHLERGTPGPSGQLQLPRDHEQ